MRHAFVAEGLALKRLLSAFSLFAAMLGASLVSGCASLSPVDQVHVNVVGVEQLPSEGMELRMGVKLRVQNPSDTPISFDGIALNLEVRGQDFATGVSDARGTIPRFGEAVLTLPVTVSAGAIVRQVVSLIGSSNANSNTSFNYVARGKLGGTGFGTARFESRGELQLPGLKQPALPAQ
jgi:LEA14-like dessication related protein